MAADNNIWGSEAQFLGLAIAIHQRNFKGGYFLLGESLRLIS